MKKFFLGKPKTAPNVLNWEVVVTPLEAILQDKDEYQNLVSQEGELAQALLDVLQLCFAIGNVSQLGGHPVASGAFGEIWKGSVAGSQEIVCLKVVKIYQSSDVEKVLKNFMREAIVWRQLEHPNLLPFLGLFYLDPSKQRLCLICPWMENGNLIQFLERTPRANVDHRRLVWDIAEGLQYLHQMKIIHADLKGVYTGLRPFHELRSDAAVIFKVMNGDRPLRPDVPELDDDVWALMNECWATDASSRPDADAVKHRLFSIFGAMESSPPWDLTISKQIKLDVRGEDIPSKSQQVAAFLSQSHERLQIRRRQLISPAQDQLSIGTDEAPLLQGSQHLDASTMGWARGWNISRETPRGRPPWQIGSPKDDEIQGELTRMIGNIIAAEQEDWELVLEICKRAYSSELLAKEAIRALRLEFKYGEPAGQLRAGRLWATMLHRDYNELFIIESTSRKFLDTLEDLIADPKTNPVVKERVLDVLAAAVFAYTNDKGAAFKRLWEKIKPPEKPDEGVPFETNDIIFTSAHPLNDNVLGSSLNVQVLDNVSSLGPEVTSMNEVPDASDKERRDGGRNTNGDPDEGIPSDTGNITGTPITSANSNRFSMAYDHVIPDRTFEYLGLSVEHQDHKHRHKHRNRKRKSPSSRNRIITPDEEIRRLFQECKIGMGNASLLADALLTTTPEEILNGSQGLIREFMGKCLSSRELIAAQIPWATAGAERSRREKDAAKQGVATGDANEDSDEQTTEERLLADLLEANEELNRVIDQYDDLERVAIERKAEEDSKRDVRMDKRAIHDLEHQQQVEEMYDFSSSGGSSGATPFSRSRSPSPSVQGHGIPPPTLRPGATIETGSRPSSIVRMPVAFEGQHATYGPEHQHHVEMHNIPLAIGSRDVTPLSNIRGSIPFRDHTSPPALRPNGTGEGSKPSPIVRIPATFMGKRTTMSISPSVLHGPRSPRGQRKLGTRDGVDPVIQTPIFLSEKALGKKKADEVESESVTDADPESDDYYLYDHDTKDNVGA
ncbi:hypothetical protein VNI00_005428 [Paramarasmius palmivorus]|uniref:Protein kinase domain-containing protein n=1 Tax=Paramarasmius palmivorus TaxID=297713 RepID=A0AAW0DEX6_9AGAR